MKRESFINHLVTGMCLVVMMMACSSPEIQVPNQSPPYDPYKEGKLPMDLPVVTRANNDGNPENTIVSARLIVIKNGYITNNKEFTISTHVYANDSIHIYDVLPGGKVDFFVIVNEKASWNLSTAFLPIGSMHFADEIEKKVLSFASHPIVDNANPIPMYKQYRNLYVNPLDGSFTLNGAVISSTQVYVERLYAKVTLLIGSIFSMLANGGEAIQLDSISVRSMPNYSYLGPDLYYTESNPAGYFNGVRTHRTSAYVSDAAHFRDSIVYYIPEHRLLKAPQTTYLSVKVSLNGNTDVAEQREYKIAIGDGIETASNDSLLAGALPMQNLFVTRNTHYFINANITSFDKTSGRDIVIRPVVVPWDSATVSLPQIDIYEYVLNLSKSTFNLTGLTLPSNTYEDVVYVETDYNKGWNANVTSVSGLGVTCFILPGNLSTVTAQPSGPLRFKFTGASGSAVIEVSTNTPNSMTKVTKRITITR